MSGSEQDIPANEGLRPGMASVTVRRQSFWDSEQCKLREALARLVDDVTRLAGGAASGAGRWCGV
jgi:hypothetical protein